MAPGKSAIVGNKSSYSCPVVTARINHRNMFPEKIARVVFRLFLGDTGSGGGSVFILVLLPNATPQIAS
jgi:hypothetical protein